MLYQKCKGMAFKFITFVLSISSCGPKIDELFWSNSCLMIENWLWTLALVIRIHGFYCQEAIRAITSLNLTKKMLVEYLL